MKNLNKILLIVAMISVWASSHSCLAQSDAKYTVLAPLPCIESAPTTYTDSNGQTQTNPGITCEGNGSVATEVDFKTYVQYTMNLLIALSAVVAVVMLVWGGIEYMYTSSFSSKKSGLERAKNALVGLLLVLTSYIILRTVDPRLVEIPNTLVPQLTIREELREDASTMLVNKIDGEIKEYTKKIEDLRKAQEKIAQDIEQNKKNEQENKERLEAIPLNDRTASSSEVALIQSNNFKIEQDRKKLEINAKIRESEKNFAQILLDVKTTFDTKYKRAGIGPLIKELQAKKTASRSEYTRALASLSKMDASAYIDPITDQFRYTDAMIDIQILEAAIDNSARGALFTEKIDIMTPTGLFTSSVEGVRDYIAKEIDKVESSAKLISNETFHLTEQVKSLSLTNEILSKTSLLLPAFDKKFKK